MGLYLLFGAWESVRNENATLTSADVPRGVYDNGMSAGIRASETLAEAVVIGHRVKTQAEMMGPTSGALCSALAEVAKSRFMDGNTRKGIEMLRSANELLHNVSRNRATTNTGVL